MKPERNSASCRRRKQLFRTRRVNEITLDEVARQADVGKGTIYLYFTDKEDLIFQTAVAGFDGMCLRLRQNATEGVAFREALLRTCETIGAFFQAAAPALSHHPVGRRAGHGDAAVGLRQRWRERRKPMAEAVAAIIAQGEASRRDSRRRARGEFSRNTCWAC